MAIGRPMPPLILDDVERETLARWVRRPKTSQALALRARMILGCAEGRSNTAVGTGLGMSDETVGKWRSRFLERRLDGLSDEPRSGRPRAVTDDDVEHVITLTLETAPRDETRWSARSMAQRSGLSHSTVSRIWRAFGLQPHRTETFKLWSDPFFIEKVRGRCGAIPESTGSGVGPVRGGEVPDPSPGSHPSAIGPCARDRWNGTPMITCATAPRRCSAPWTPGTGQVIGQCHRRHRAVEFRKFLDTPIPRYHRGRGARRPRRPPDRGQLRHPQDGADPELGRQATPASTCTSRPPHALHAHQRLLAEPPG